MRFRYKRLPVFLLVLCLLLTGCSFGRKDISLYRPFREIQWKQKETLMDLKLFQKYAAQILTELGAKNIKFEAYGNCTDIIICQSMDALYRVDDRWVFVSAYIPQNKTWRITVIENAENGHCYYSKGEESEEYQQYRDNIEFEESFDEELAARKKEDRGKPRQLYDFLTDTPLPAESDAESAEPGLSQ